MTNIKKYKLNDVADIKTGPFGSLLHESDYVGIGTPIITVEHLSEKGILHKNMPFVSDNDKQRLKSFMLKEGDIVFSRVGAVDRSAVVTAKEEGWLFSGRLLRVRPDPIKVCYQYLNQYFQTQEFKNYINRMAVGGTMPSLNTHILENIEVFLPTLDVQKSFGTLLTTWDTAIEKTERLIEAKEKYLNHYVSRLITASEYSCMHIRNIASEVSVRNQAEQCKRALSVTNDRGFVLPEDQFDRRVASENLSNYKLVTKGQYAYNPSRINVGSIARLDGWDEGALSPMYVVFKLKEKMVTSDFFLHWLSSHAARERIKRSAQGSVRETVSFGDFGAISLPLPDMTTQVKIVKTLNAMKQEIDMLNQLTDAYRKQKGGLMQKLLTGKWRVKAWEEKRQ